MTKTSLNNNKAKDYGGALYNIQYFNDNTINDSTFTNNRAEHSGAFYTMSADNYELISTNTLEK